MQFKILILSLVLLLSTIPAQTQLLSFLPSVVMNLPIQLIGGFLPGAVLKVFSAFCSTVISSGVVKPPHTPDINAMNLELITPKDRFSFPLNNAATILNSSEFDKNKKIVLFITGWRIDISKTNQVDNIAAAFHCRNDTNFILLDASNSIRTLYIWSAFNTQDVGEALATGLAQITKEISPKHIHLIGHSLGSHIAGATGKHYQELTGNTLARISGLDPATPCYNGELKQLSDTDADFVDVVHTNPGVLGTVSPLGHVDVFAGGLEPLQKGTVFMGAAHMRAIEYFAETCWPDNENNFPAAQCDAYPNISIETCNGPKVPFGYSTPTTARGLYVFDVHPSSPYGLGNSVENSKANAKCTKTD